MRLASISAVAQASRVFANARSQFVASVGREFLGVVQADDAASRIQNDGGGDNRTKQRAPPCFIESSDAQPTALPRFALVPRATKSSHRPRILAQAFSAVAHCFGPCFFAHTKKSPSRFLGTGRIQIRIVRGVLLCSGSCSLLPLAHSGLSARLILAALPLR